MYICISNYFNETIQSFLVNIWLLQFKYLQIRVLSATIPGKFRSVSNALNTTSFVLLKERKG